MGRLTELIEYYSWKVNELAEGYEIATRCMETGEIKEYNKGCQRIDDTLGALKELQHYKDLEEQGRLIELLYKVGDTVYYINTQNRLSLFKNTVYEAKVARFVTTRYGISIVIQIRNEYGCTELYIEDNYNKTVFLTKEEAEAKLKELKEGVE